MIISSLDTTFLFLQTDSEPFHQLGYGLVLLGHFGADVYVGIQRQRRSELRRSVGSHREAKLGGRAGSIRWRLKMHF